MVVQNKIGRLSVPGTGKRTDVKHKKSVSDSEVCNVGVSVHQHVPLLQHRRNTPSVVPVAVCEKKASVRSGT